MRLRVLLAALVALALLPSAPDAQSFGIGARLAFVRNDPDDNTDVEREASTDRYWGGFLRARLSDRG